MDPVGEKLKVLCAHFIQESWLERVKSWWMRNVVALAALWQLGQVCVSSMLDFVQGS